MATPQILVQTVNATLVDGSPGSFRVNTFNPNGTVLDVHTGYTMQTLDAAPSAQPNPLAPLADLSGQVSHAFDATGVTVSWTDVQSAAIAALLPQLSEVVGMYLSNDAGTTASLAAKINLQVDAFSILG